MRQILLIGIGQTGVTVAESFLGRFHSSDTMLKALAVDTDRRVLSDILSADKIDLSDSRSLSGVAEALGEDKVCSYFPCDWVNDRSAQLKGLDMHSGSNLWRMKAFLAFNAFLADEKRAPSLTSALDSFLSEDESEDGIEIYTVASLAGGTGSGLLLPFTLFVKKYLEGHGKKILASRAYLSMPNVYKSVFPAERATKSSANAYAALREIHAVNTVAFSENGRDASEQFPVKFKITVENDQIGTLFDSDDGRFATPSAAPFHSILLLDAIPTVSTVSDHVSVLADAVLFDACGERRGVERDTTFSCVSMTRVEYPLHTVVDSIVKQQLSDFVTRELGNVKKTVDDRVRSRMMTAKNERRRLTQSIELYRDCYIETVEDMLADFGGSPERLIGRHFDESVKLDAPPDLYAREWRVRLDEEISRSVQNEGLLWIKKAITEEKQKDEKEKKLSRRRSDVTELALTVREKLAAAYRGVQTTLGGENERIAQELLFQGSGDAPSIVTELLCDRSAFLHPIYALFKLCLVHRELEGYKKCEPVITSLINERHPLPTEIMTVDSARVAKNKYLKQGEDRFIELLDAARDADKMTARERKKSPYLKLDRESLFNDLESVYDRLLSDALDYRYLAIVEMLERFIVRYKALLDRFCQSEDVIEKELALARFSGSVSNAIVLRVGASEEDKDRLCSAYFKAYESDLSALAENDRAIAARIAALACDDPVETIDGTAVRTLLSDIEALYREHLLGTPFYKSALDQSILDLVNAEGDRAPSMAPRYEPLKVTVDPEDRRREHITERARLILSDRLSVTDADVRERLGDLLMPDTELSFIGGVSTREMVLCREKSGFALDFVEYFNETLRDQNGYAAYAESVTAARRQSTPMWDPNLLYARDGSLSLPFISPRKQAAYEQATAEATVYALLKGIVFPVSDGKRERVYSVRIDGVETPILQNGSAVKLSAPDRLLLWAYEHPAWTEQYAKEYAEHIGDHSTEELFELLLDLTQRLDKRGTRHAELCAELFAVVLNAAFLGRYLNPKGILEERGARSYVRRLDACLAKAEERLGTEQMQAFFKRLNAKECFLDYSDDYSRLCAFDFE